MALSEITAAREPPRDLTELAARAAALAGRSLAGLAREFGEEARGPSVRRKGKVGQLFERVLGASAGSRKVPDFVGLGIELKTLPIDALGRPLESTFVCSFSVADADCADWASSALRAKLSHVLFVPLIEANGERTVGVPFFWRPCPQQQAILRADFDDLVGLIALGHIEAVTARLGRWLQLRPKAAHGRVRTHAWSADGEHIATIPRGFYLRARVTRALLENPRTLLDG
jgi:DNA mismatch repair protein MutH